MASSAQTHVEDVMSAPVETISRNATVMEAVARMREHDISALLVTTSPAAIVTSTDVLDALAEGRDIEELQVSDVMTTEVETVPPDIRLEEAAAMMTNFGFKHLPVRKDDYVGIVSTMDLAKHLS